MKYLFYTTSESAWDGLYMAMEKATKSIFIEMYIFVDDTERTNDFISLLVKKAEEGIRVRIILDLFGSMDLSSKAEKRMEKAGIELLFFRKWFRRLHRKIVIIDGRVGFFGGVNIHELARKWNDLLVRVEGPIVKSLLRSFRRTYRFCGGKDENILSYKQKAVFGRTRIWMLEHIPYIRKPRLMDAYVETISKAQSRVTLVSPYFTPSKWLINLLLKTVERKVDVEVILPARSDIPFFSRANLRYINKLAPYGVTFWMTNKMTHAKLLLVDESIALVGSQNIDSLSFDFNAELGIFFTDQAMISDLKKIITSWKKDAKIFNLFKKITFGDKILSFVVRLLQPFL